MYRTRAELLALFRSTEKTRVRYITSVTQELGAEIYAQTAED
jgi:hypothetical protein